MKSGPKFFYFQTRIFSVNMILTGQVFESILFRIFFYFLSHIEIVNKCMRFTEREIHLFHVSKIDEELYMHIVRVWLVVLMKFTQNKRDYLRPKVTSLKALWVSDRYLFLLSVNKICTETYMINIHRNRDKY